MVDFTIDSIGNIEKFNPTKYLHFDKDLNVKTWKGFEKFDSSYVIDIESILKSTRWKPIVYNSKIIKGRVKIPIIFNLYGFISRSDGIVINVPMPILEVYH